MNKISALNLVLWIGIGCHHAAFAQTSTDISKLSSKNKTVQSKQNPSQTVVLGQVITASQFRKITEYSTSKASRNPIDFCVGVIDDDEQAMSLEGLSYRQYHNQYAIDQILFTGKTENFKVAYASMIFDKNTTPKQIKALKAEVIQSIEKGVWADGFRQQKYPYTSIYRIRKLNADDLIYAYFNAQKLIGLQYVVQC